MPNAPYRADHVGSFLRPQALKDAWAKRDKGEITAAQSKTVEEQSVSYVAKKQEECGLQLATDGEFRRAVWSTDFLAALGGMESYIAAQGVMFKGRESTRKSARLISKLHWNPNHPFIEHFKYLKAHTGVTAKFTIPSPSVAHFRTAMSEISPVYKDVNEYFDDLAKTYKACVQSFYDAGCRYLQFDDTVWAHMCDPTQLEEGRKRGHDVAALQATYVRIINYAIKDRPKDMAITTHACRGNFRSTFVSSGGYEPVAEAMFQTDYDGYFLEYDTDRAGGFEPLRFLPKGKKRVVLGLITSKFAPLEKKDDLKRRIDEAAKFAPLDQLCLSPQCGFASTEEGNDLTEDEQWAKIRLTVEVAKEVWGTA